MKTSALKGANTANLNQQTMVPLFSFAFIVCLMVYNNRWLE